MLYVTIKWRKGCLIIIKKEEEGRLYRWKVLNLNRK